MKQLFAIFLTVAILAQSLVQVGVVVYYQINKAYISQKLCENRSNPNLHCNGHCYLSKQLKKADEREQKQTKSILKEQEEIIQYRNELPSAIYFPAYASSAFNPYLTIEPISDYRNELLKPPTV